MGLGDIYEIKLHGMWNGSVDIFNVFHYQQKVDSDNPTPELTLANFKSVFFDGTSAWNDVSVSILNYDSLEWSCVTDDSQPIGSIVIDYTGGASGDPMPPETAFGLRYYPSMAHRRSGYKRIAGVSEGAQSTGTVTDAATLAVLDDLALICRQGINIDDSDIFQIDPIILSKMLNGEPRPVPLPTQLSTVRALRRLSTQNSRKD